MLRKSVLFALPLVAACVTAAGNGQQNLAGSSWRIVRIDGAPPVSERAAISFTPDRVSATAGCNGIGGEWSARNGRIISGPFVSTMMYCEGVMAQERALADLFEAHPTYTLAQDRLTLAGGGHRVELTRAN